MEVVMSRAHGSRVEGSAWLLRWHRRIGIVIAVALIGWCASGICHPLMTRVQPKPAAFAPPLLHISDERLPAPAELLGKTGITRITGLRLVELEGRPLLQLALPGQGEYVYVSAQTGAVIPNGDRRYAQALARHYTGNVDAAITDAQLLTSFDGEYAEVNRLLPVWRISFAGDEHLRAYIDTGASRLGALLNDKKATLSAVFRAVHTWHWAEEANTVRVSIMVSLLLGALFVAGGGFWIYVLRWRLTAARWNLRRLHRVAGASVSLVALLMIVSGAWHLISVPTRATSNSPAKRTSIDVRTLVAPLDAVLIAGGPIAGLTLVEVGGRTAYLITPAMPVLSSGGMKRALHDHGGAGEFAKLKMDGQQRYVDAAKATTIEGAAEGHVLELARYFLDLGGRKGEVRFAAVEPVISFGGEYGFANKRLPVTRVALDAPGNEALYIEAATGVLAAHVTTASRAEGYVFSWLHKWDPLAAWIGKDARDVLQVIFVSTIAGACLLGCLLYLRRKPNAVRARRVVHAS